MPSINKASYPSICTSRLFRHFTVNGIENFSFNLFLVFYWGFKSGIWLFSSVVHFSMTKLFSFASSSKKFAWYILKMSILLSLLLIDWINCAICLSSIIFYEFTFIVRSSLRVGTTFHPLWNARQCYLDYKRFFYDSVVGIFFIILGLDIIGSISKYFTRIL